MIFSSVEGLRALSLVKCQEERPATEWTHFYFLPHPVALAWRNVSRWNSERSDLGDEKDKIYKLKLIDLSEAERCSELLWFDFKKNKLGGNREDPFFSWLKLICPFGWLKDIMQNIYETPSSQCCTSCQGPGREAAGSPLWRGAGAARAGHRWVKSAPTDPAEVSPPHWPSLCWLEISNQPVLDAGRNPFQSFRLPERGGYCPFPRY